IGERLSRFALDVLRSDSAAAERRLILQRVVGEITETCNLAVLKKGALIYLDRVEAPWPLRLHVPEGGVALPPHCCASGKLLLAHLAAPERQRLLERMPLQRFTERTLTDRAVLESELARIVSVGYAVDNEEYVLGVACVADHLAKRGCKDVLLLERRQLTCGTTWHAAGLVGQLRATRNLTRLAQYTTQLYEGLERETGQATGFRQVGSIAVAASAARFEE